MPRSPRRRVPFVTVTSRSVDAPRPVGAMHRRKSLAVATTARTTRFSRTQRFRLRPAGFAGQARLRPKASSGTGAVRSTRLAASSRVSAQSSARPAPTSAPALPRPPHPNPRSRRRTIAPLLGSGWRECAANPNFGKVEYFCERGLTGFGEAGVLPDGPIDQAPFPALARRVESINMRTPNRRQDQLAKTAKCPHHRDRDGSSRSQERAHSASRP